MNSRGKHKFNRNNRRNNWKQNNSNNRSRNLNIEIEQLTEVEAGISAYISEFPGFNGVIKERFSDFHVNEIDSNGVVAKLTDTKFPEAFNQKQVPLSETTTIEEISQEKWDEILKLIQSKDKSQKVLLPAGDKEERTKIHQKIKEAFGTRVSSNGTDIDGAKYIEIQIGGRKDNEWPKGIGEYVHFLLYKESIDTMAAILKICDVLNLPQNVFNYAGNKDKRAKTTQWVSARMVNPYKLLFKLKQIRNVKVGNLKFLDSPLKLGMLKGNRFRIALRNVDADDDQINKIMEYVKEMGFINYYGLQRFGNDKEVPSFEIGVKLLQAKYKEACDLILKLKKSDDPASFVTLAKKIYHETGNAKDAYLKLQNNTSSIESKLLEGLKDNPKSYVPALDKIPRNTRLLYLHSFQSYIWNQVVSKRIKDFGIKPIPGDLVIADKNTENIESADSDIIEREDTPEGEVEVKVLTESDIDNYTIWDIVLPTPGYKIKYPENTLKDYYEELLNVYGLSTKMEQNHKTYSVSGNYRFIVVKPTELSWSVMRYNDNTVALIQSDMEELLGHSKPEDIPDGKFKALILNFNLPSSCYATMFLREIMKIDTSNAAQTKRNNYQNNTKVNESQNGDVKNEIEAEMDGGSLLSDKDKFEAFKRAVFADDNDDDTPKTSVKRSIEANSEESAKKIKIG